MAVTEADATAMQPDMEQEDVTNSFFLRDTGVRLDRAVEVSLAYAAFALLLYCRFLCPGGTEYWHWLEPSSSWVVVFAPLFLLDLRSVQHTKYLRRHRERFTQHEGVRHLVICLAEFLYKVLLCLHLVFQDARAYFSLKLVMIPYAVGYVVHFILGHIAPLDDGERAEGCNVVSTLLSELARFLQFVLIIVLSLKIDSSSSSLYNWQAAFWPCWGLEGIIVMVVVLLLPLCMMSAVIDRPQLLMLTWIVLAGAGLSTASFLSMYNVADLLDKHLCPDPVVFVDEVTPEKYMKCRQRLEQTLWPWLVYLPAFAVGTLLIKARLVLALHAAWYQNPLSPVDGGRRSLLRSAHRGEVLPPPPVMFRVAPTFYSRAWTPELDTVSVVARAAARDAIMGSGRFPSTAGNGANLVTLGSGLAVDHSTSLLSARGATFVDIVEGEQLCFVCYDNAPDAILMECGHAGMCIACATNIFDDIRRPATRQRATCPICRASIASVLRIDADTSLPQDLFQPRPLLPSRRGDEQQGTEGLEGVDETCCGTGAAAAAAPEPTHSGAPPWPHAARRVAVAVEEIRALPRSSRWTLLR
mmetsp:Transcript_33072/g.73699  ORF Transcript_33072/g.73699 Transcript_33072/m.73699 type:complete len:583 (-) Transcript_33072:52-1800(-)